MIACAVVLLLAHYALHGGHVVTSINPSFTFQFLDLFAICAWMAHYADLIARTVRRVPDPLVIAFALIALCVQGRRIEYVMYAEPVLLVAANFAYPALARLYGLQPFVWLGERSFSLYLVHVPLLLAMVYLLHGRMPIAVILAGALPSACSARRYSLDVERPSCGPAGWSGVGCRGARASTPRPARPKAGRGSWPAGAVDDGTSAQGLRSSRSWV